MDGLVGADDVQASWFPKQMMSDLSSLTKVYFTKHEFHFRDRYKKSIEDLSSNELSNP